MPKDGQQLYEQRKPLEITTGSLEEQDKLTNYNTENFATLLAHQDRMVFDLSDGNTQDEEYAKLKKQGDLDMTKAELDEIDKLLELSAEGELENYTDVTNKDFEAYRDQLQFKRSMDIAQLLVNDHSKSDSSDMQDVKIDLMSLAVEMERMNSLPVSKDSICDLSAKFTLSLRSISHYLSTKNPHFSSGKKRYEKVAQMQGALLMVKASLDSVAADLDKYEGRTIGSLLGMRESKEGDLTRKQEDKEPLTLSPDADFLYTIFSDGYDLSAFYIEASPRKRRKETAKILELK
ncbi:MAG: hypothetical protein J6N76_04365, partial [Lachnospiraceae bacterium]|nr:hypothetical protein [Lachnospiraceae bacterium]